MAADLEGHVFSLSKLTNSVKSILSKSSRTTDLINQLAKKGQYVDVLFYTWKTLMKFLNENSESCDIFMLNVLELLEKISITKVINEEEKEGFDEHQILGLQKGGTILAEMWSGWSSLLTGCKPITQIKLHWACLVPGWVAVQGCVIVMCHRFVFAGLIDHSENFVLNRVLLKKYVKKVWQLLIKREMSPAVHKKLLFVLLEMYIGKLENPIFLTDFFMSSLNLKGVVQILALQGVSILMQKHNIEYPNIYGKLYTLFEPSVFHTKYKARLFYLANIFLSSTHLPENLVASFAKRASRLSLTCATPDILIILRFIGNLLMRHTGLIKMIHHPSILEVPEDPFLENENDPMKTRASESSLWEISLLSNHCQPSISSAAKFIHFKLPSLEFDLAEVLDNSYVTMFESECKKTRKIQPSVTFQRPQDSIARLKDDLVFKLWSLNNYY